jgi:subtilase family protein
MKHSGRVARILALTFAALAFAFPLSGSLGASGSTPTQASSGAVLPNFASQGSNLIRLLAGAFDPLLDPLPAQAAIPAINEATLAPIVPQYWLAQPRAGEDQQVADAVTSAGGTIAGFIPDAAYIVRATPTQKNQIAASSSVRWIGYYQPAWRVPVATAGKLALVDLPGTQTYRVHVFRGEPAAGAVGQALRAIPGVQVVADNARVVDVRATAAQIPVIAAIPAIEWVAIKPVAVALNSNARWVTDTGVRDLYAATAAGRLTGAGQTAADADTGLNYTYDLNGRAHIAFRDCDGNSLLNCKQAIYTSATPGDTTTAGVEGVVNNSTAHRKMVAYFDLGATGPNMFDESSHGSHTAGSVDGDQPPYDVYTADDGMAPAANHVHQNIADGSGGLGGQPDVYYDLFRQAYEPRNPVQVESSSAATGNPNGYCVFGTGACRYKPLEDARTHNNSYGLIAPIIDDGEADLLDEFVWDHEDMSIVVSAGNDGPVLASIGTPSVAKNELSSGAGANGRQPMVSIDSVAVFSSHGPTGDGRFGPDLITPGQIVVSVKGGTNDGYHVAQGTSMSAPVLTGLATLVRQYYFDGYGAGNFVTMTGAGGFASGAAGPTRQHNPSAALVKATLVNGAVRLRGFYSGSDGDVRALDGQWPSEGQGFGRVNLDNSLYFANDPSNLWFMDVYRGNTTAPAECTAAGGVTTTDCTSFAAGANGTRNFTIHVEPGKPLDVTLAWTDFASGLAAGSPALVDNLDLKVTGPGGTTYVGNNMNSRSDPSVAVAETMNAAAPVDTKNNVERIRVASPAVGDYTITVTSTLTVPMVSARQGFALAASGNISKVGGPPFVPGPPLQADEPGTPTITNVKVSASSANTAKVTFDTNEPTTATADATVTGGPHTFVDSYNIGAPADWPGLTPGPVETSAEYANKPVVGTKHEILLTGLSAGATAVTLKAKDLANNEFSQATAVTTPATVFQANAPDTAQLYQDAQSANDPRVGKWQTGTQMYASDDGGGNGSLGAFMFRIPSAAINPADITGATVELVSTHNWTIPYIGDPEVYVDLLNPSVEANWGTQDYAAIHDAAADARVAPESTDRRGAYQRYAFSFRCADLQKLRDTLATVTSGQRAAAFRYDATVATPLQLFATEFGFNRRSRGPELRPRLILSLNNDPSPAGEACDASSPAPTITEVGIHAGTQAGSMTVSWETDVLSDSLVTFREKTTVPWIQVGSPARVRMHHVQIFGLDSTKDYEFMVRSAGCNGAATTDTNGGQGYDFFRPPLASFTEYFSGVAQDQANKVANTPTATFQTAAPTTEPPIVQLGVGTFPLANNTFHQARGTYWDGVIPNGIPPLAKITFHFFTSSVTGNAFTTSEHLTLFKNGTAFHEEDIGLSGGAMPVDNEITVSLRPGETISAGQMLSVQLAQTFVDNDWQIHYFAPSTPSRFTALLETPPNLPLAGPVPPPSAGDSGLTAPALRTGAASAEDIAAGTCTCSIANPTSVRVVFFSGRATGRRGVALTWRTASEVSVLGFNVWRFASSGQWAKVNRTLLPAKAAGRAGGARYSLLDRHVRPGAYTYRLQVVDRSGARAWRASTAVRVRRPR